MVKKLFVKVLKVSDYLGDNSHRWKDYINVILE
jgi:hypothetical protein